MLITEFRLLYAARRLRPKEPPRGRRSRYRYWMAEVVDLDRRRHHRGATTSR
jgi:energy-coupling factor transport system permease protein